MLLDALTGVYSRAYLQQRLQEEVERAGRYNESFSLVMVDIDYYKSVNDAFGHSRGDKVLVEFARRLQSIVRSSDLIFRYGGDEFVLLLPNTKNDSAVSLAQRVMNKINLEPFEGDPPLGVSISIGVATFPEDGQQAETLFDEADQRQYEAKRRGRRRIVAKKLPQPGEPVFEQRYRLVERDNELRALQRFLKELQNARRGALVVRGEPGSGRTRFLVEVGKAARLHGYEVASLNCNPALSARVYGVLNEGFKDWDLPLPLSGINKFESALAELVEARGRSGLIIAADSFIDCDWATLELLHNLFNSTAIKRLGLAYSVEPRHAQRLMMPEASLQESVTLQPLSLEGMRIWLRTLMQWEPPLDFVEWLHREHAGLPAPALCSLHQLVEIDVLKRQSRGWAVDKDYQKFRSKEAQGLKSQAFASNLPVPTTSFIGRDQEILLAKEILNKVRLLTLTGPGGVGKTRLAIQLAAECSDQYPQGVFFVPLVPLNSAEFLVSAIAESLEFSFYPGEMPAAQLTSYLREKQILLLLDNFEHIIQGSQLVAQILENAPKVKVLATSLERLNLTGEAVMELKGMTFPKEKTAQGLEIYSSIQLFLLYARHACPDFKPNREDMLSIVRICQMLDGLPLAIELAAAWVRVLPVTEIAKEIEQTLDFLVTPMRDVPERHRSLRAVFEHSWKLLKEDEKNAFSKLSVFSRGFRREAALQVTGASLAVLTTFVDKSLLQVNSSGRYSMQEALRQYAHEKLAQAGEAKTIAQKKHCFYYMEFLEQQDCRLNGAEQKKALEEIGVEMGNIRTAWRYAIEQGEARALEKSLPCLCDYYIMRGFLQEGEEVFERTAQKLESLASQEKPDLEILLGKVYTRLGSFYSRLALYQKARDTFNKSLDIWKKTTDKENYTYLKEIGVLYQSQALLEDRMAEYDKAVHLSQKGLEIYQQIDYRQGIAEILNELGVIEYMKGNYAMSSEHLHQSLDIFKGLQQPWGMAQVLINLGNTCWELGHLDKARQQYQESLAVCRELGDQVGMAVLLNNLGDVAREMGEYEEAKELLQESLRICEDMGDNYGTTIALNNLVDVAIRQDEYMKAQRLIEKSLKISEKIGNRMSLGYSLFALGSIALGQGQLEKAHQYFLDTLEIAAESRSIPFILETLVKMAVLFQRQGDTPRAVELAAMITNHPAGNRESKEAAQGLLDAMPGGAQPQQTPRSLDEVLESLLPK